MRTSRLYRVQSEFYFIGTLFYRHRVGREKTEIWLWRISHSEFEEPEEITLIILSSMLKILSVHYIDQAINILFLFWHYFRWFVCTRIRILYNVCKLSKNKIVPLSSGKQFRTHVCTCAGIRNHVNLHKRAYMTKETKKYIAFGKANVPLSGNEVSFNLVNWWFYRMFCERFPLANFLSRLQIFYLHTYTHADALI